MEHGSSNFSGRGWLILGVRVTYLFAAFLALTSLPAQEKGFRAGASAVDISPQVFPIQLRSGPSDLVHDPLHVRAVAFEHLAGDKGEGAQGRAVIALIDAIGIGRDMSDAAKAEAAARTGWRPEQMLVCATHTHTAPKGGEGSPGRVDYEKRKLEGITEALVGAIENLQPARVAPASAALPDEVYNRRWYLKPGTERTNPFGKIDKVEMNPPRQHIVRPAGPTDPEIAILDVRTARGRPLGLIANYALHYIGDIPSRMVEGREVGMASASYFGEFSRIMPSRVRAKDGDGFVAMMTNGASGDINNIDFDMTRPPRAPFEQVRVVATKAADAVWRALGEIEEDQYDPAPAVAMLQREVTLSYRTMTAEEVANAREILGFSRKEREGLHKKATGYANQTIAHAEPDRTEDVLIQAIRIGDQAIVSMPFEVLVEIGLEIKERSPFPHTFLVELANGGYGYLPPPNQHALGGYETWIGTCRFVPETSVLLTEQLLEMLAELEAME